MTNPRNGDFSPEQLADMHADLLELEAFQVQKNVIFARESQVIHRLTQRAVAVQEQNLASREAAEIPYRTVAAEIGAAVRMSDRTAQRMMSEAYTLVTKFPATVASLATGRVSQTHARVIVDTGIHITDDEARLEFEQTVLPVAERESANRLRPFAKRAGEHIHPRSLTERHTAAAKERSIRVTDLSDGMAELIAILPGTLAHAAYDRLSSMAREVARTAAAEAKTARSNQGGQCAGVGASVGASSGAASGVSAGGKGPGATFVRDKDVTHAFVRDTRTADQLRADIFTDLLLAGAPQAGIPTGLGAIRAQVQVVVPVFALLGHTEEPATLTGVGPMDAEMARRLAGGAKGWDRVLTHPITGAVLATDRYRPGKDLKRALEVRDQHCRFPGCRMAVWKCDLDHTIDYAHGGETRECNLAHLCRRHHMLKHESGWTVEQQPGGVLVWTSPTGRVYPDIPTSRVMFKPVPNAPPDTALDSPPF